MNGIFKTKEIAEIIYIKITIVGCGNFDAPKNGTLPVHGIYVEATIALAKKEGEKMNLVLKTKIFLARNNPERIIEYLNDPQYDLTDSDKYEIIESLKDLDLVRIAIKDKTFAFNQYQINGLIASVKDKNFVKECLRDPELEFTCEFKAMLIKETKDVELVKEYLQNEGKQEEGKEHNTYLIASTENYEFIEECLFDEELGFDEKQKVNLIVSTDNDKFIKKCLKNEKLGFENQQKAKLVRAVGKVELIKECIYDETLGFTNAEKIDMILGSDNNRFIRKCLNDERLAFNIDEKMSLLLLTDDLRLIKESIREEDFNIEQKIQLIIATQDTDFMRGCLRNKVLALEANEKEALIASIQDIYFLKECVDSGDISIDKLSDIQKTQIGIMQKYKKQLEREYGQLEGKRLDLPKDMTVGMEIECEGVTSEFLGEEFRYGKWEAKGDASLDNGIEIVSPILHPTEKDSQEIYTVTSILNRIGQYISDKCGGHIHIGAKYLTSVQSYMNLLELYCNNEKALYAMSNEKGEAPRNVIPKYAPPISGKMQEAIEKGTINLEDEIALNRFAEGLKTVQESRYSGINFMNVRDESNTIEFRLANGTINPEMWIENANLFGGMVAVAEELSQIQKNGIRTEEDKHKLEMFDKLKEDIDEKEKVKILLELVGVEPETYMQRYETNIGLIKENQEIQKVFDGKKTLDFKVAKDKFKGKESQEIELSARAQVEARDNILEGHERNLQNERDDRNHAH